MLDSNLRRVLSPSPSPSPSPSHTLAVIYINMGQTHNSLCLFPKAIEFYEKALTIHHTIGSIGYLNLGTIYNNLSTTYHCMGDLKRASSYLEKAQEIERRHLSLDHEICLHTQVNTFLLEWSKDGSSNLLPTITTGSKVLRRHATTNDPKPCDTYLKGLITPEQCNHGVLACASLEQIEEKSKRYALDQLKMSIAYGAADSSAENTRDITTLWQHSMKMFETQQGSHLSNENGTTDMYSSFKEAFSNIEQISATFFQSQDDVHGISRSQPSIEAFLATSISQIEKVFNRPSFPPQCRSVVLPQLYYKIVHILLETEYYDEALLYL